MSVNKKLLAQKTDKELLQYVQPESRFTRAAIKCAFDILTARNYSFTPEEMQHINFLLRDKEKREEIYIHPNHKMGATLMYVCAGLSLVNMLTTYNNRFFDGFIVTKILAVAFLAGLGLLISRGIGQVKYILIVTQLFWIFVMLPILLLIKIYPLLVAINLIQRALQIYVMILLFKVPK